MRSRYDKGTTNLAALHETLEELQLSTDERRDFYSAFVGALSNHAPKKHWASAIQTAKGIALADRERHPAGVSK